MSEIGQEKIEIGVSTDILDCIIEGLPIGERFVDVKDRREHITIITQTGRKLMFIVDRD